MALARPVLTPPDKTRLLTCFLILAAAMMSRLILVPGPQIYALGFTLPSPGDHRLVKEGSHGL